MLPHHSLLLFIVHVGREVDESLLLLSENNNESQQRNDIMLYPAGYGTIPTWYWYCMELPYQSTFVIIENNHPQFSHKIEIVSILILNRTQHTSLFDFH
jgi:hypothetical protein